MKRIEIQQLYNDPAQFGGQTITVGGWCRTIRSSNAFGFIELNDGSAFKNLQVVIEADKLENYKNIAKQNVGASFVVTGELVLTPEAKQPFELKATEITVDSAPTVSDARIPCSTRLSISRPMLSVPSRCVSLGGLFISRREVWVGP